MSKANRRLGKGLESLVGSLTKPRPEKIVPSVSSLPDEDISVTEDTINGIAGQTGTTIPLALIDPNPFQPRSHPSGADISSLAASIETNGVVQPVVTRRVGNRYQLVAGERRWRAVQMLGHQEIPAIVRDATDEQMLELALVENIQRQDLNAIDRALAYRSFCDSFGVKPEEVGRRLGEDRSTVVNYLRLLELPESIKALVASRRLSMGHARCLLGLERAEDQEQLAQRILLDQLSVRATEALVRRSKSLVVPPADGSVTSRSREKSPHLVDLQARFEKALKTKVSIQEYSKPGTGRIVIEYYSLDDFDRISSKLGIAPG